MTGFNQLSAVVTIVVIISVLGYASGTIHAKKCDDRCGGSRLNPLGPTGTCSMCCNSHGFSRGGECGDFLSRHCRCWENPPVFPGGQQMQPYPQQPYPAQPYLQQPYPQPYPQLYPGFGG